MKIRLQLELPEDLNLVSYSQSLMPRHMGGPAKLPLAPGPRSQRGGLWLSIENLSSLRPRSPELVVVPSTRHSLLLFNYKLPFVWFHHYQFSLLWVVCLTAVIWADAFPMVELQGTCALHFNCESSSSFLKKICFQSFPQIACAATLPNYL